MYPPILVSIQQRFIESLYVPSIMSSSEVVTSLQCRWLWMTIACPSWGEMNCATGELSPNGSLLECPHCEEKGYKKCGLPFPHRDSVWAPGMVNLNQEKPQIFEDSLCMTQEAQARPSSRHYWDGEVSLTYEKAGERSNLKMEWAAWEGNELSGARSSCTKSRWSAFAENVTKATQAEEEEVDKVTSNSFSPEVAEYKEQDLILGVQLSPHQSVLGLAILPSSKSLTSIKDGQRLQRPLRRISCYWLWNSSATGILRETQFSTRRNRKEEICVRDIRWVSTSPLKTEFGPKLTVSRRNSPAVLGHPKRPGLCFWSLEFGIYCARQQPYPPSLHPLMRKPPFQNTNLR